jgi:hypothetical protein
MWNEILWFTCLIKIIPCSTAWEPNIEQLSGMWSACIHSVSLPAPAVLALPVVVWWTQTGKLIHFRQFYTWGAYTIHTWTSELYFKKWVHLVIVLNENKKFCDELITCFPLIHHGLHRKRCHQQFFIAAGTCLRSSCLAVIVGDTDSPLVRHGPYRKWRAQQFFYCCVYSLPWERVHQALQRWQGGRESPPPHTRAQRERERDWQEGFMKYAVGMGSGAMIYSYIISFIKIGSDIQKSIGG